MTKEVKTEALTIRIKPSIKALAQRLADAEGRSISNLIEQLLLAEAVRSAQERISQRISELWHAADQSV